jgi:hypothetical protein
MEALGTWPLTGRDEELSILVGLIEGRDQGAGVVIAGRPGVGKTRLGRSLGGGNPSGPGHPVGRICRVGGPVRRQPAAARAQRYRGAFLTLPSWA